MDRRQFLGGIVAATAGLAALSTLPVSSRKNGVSGVPAADRRRNRFPNVPLRTHEGREVRFYDDLIKGRTVMLNFFYTKCVGESICPLGTANLVKVQEILGERAGRDIFMYSITLDPEYDTPPILERYARGFGAKPGWEFLTGAKEDIERLRRALGYVNLDPVKDRDRSQHSGMLRYGIEPLERWAACPILTRPKWIARYVAWMEPGGERPELWPRKGIDVAAT